MKYKSLHFDHEVINALYSPKDIKYWKHYMNAFHQQIDEHMHFIESNPDKGDGNYILGTKKHLVERMINDLRDLVEDLLNTDYDAPLTQFVLKRFELMDYVDYISETNKK